jgi:alcohol dehydrogenase
MKAVVYRECNTVKVEDVERPKLRLPTDVLIEVTAAAICGSEVHRVKEGSLAPGTVMGHEYCGIVEEVGEGVRKLKKGDRVVGSPVYYCGSCYFCQHKQQALCETGGLVSSDINQGTQAEFARIPFADNTLTPVPKDLPDEDVIFTGDILSTGFSGMLRARPHFGDSVAIFGAGPVGLCAVACAPLFGTGRVIAVDVLDYRLEMARKFGALTINASKEDTVARIKELTGGRGVDIGIEAAGFESTLNDCFKSTRMGGTVSIIGTVPDSFRFKLSERFFDIFNLNIGLGDQNYREELVTLIQNGKLKLKPLITHVLPLTEAARGYEIFDKKLEKCIKVVLKPKLK